MLFSFFLTELFGLFKACDTKCVHTSERHLLFFCFPWLFLIVSASLLWKRNWWVMKRMVPRSRLNETFYSPVVKPQLYHSAWQPCLQSPEGFAVEGEQLGFLRLRAVHWLAQGCTVCQVSEQNLVTWFLFGCSPLNQEVLLCLGEGSLCSHLCCRSPAWACQFIRASLNLSFGAWFMIAHEQLCFTTQLLLDALFYCRGRLNLRLPGSVFRSLVL